MCSADVQFGKQALLEDKDMTSIAFIIGMAVLGVCIIVAAVILSGAITGAAASLKEGSPKALQQPVLNFLTEFDAADYLGLGITELDYVRNEGMLDGTFIAVTSLEQTGVSEATEFENGVEVTKSKPVMAQVTRFLFDKELLDQKMLELIREGKHINPYRKKNKKAKSAKVEEKPVKEEPIYEEPAEEPVLDESADAEYSGGYALPDEGDDPVSYSSEED